jgi:TorA maturation chaperone TorD
MKAKTKPSGKVKSMEQQPADISEAMESAQARAGMYNFLANLFNQRPDLELVRRLREMGSEGFNEGISPGDISPEVEQGLQEMASFIDVTQDWLEEKVEQDLVVDWTRLFRGISPSYGPPPPYEGVYDNGTANPSDVLQTVMQTYHKYSVDLDENAANRPDYIGIELDFLRYLNESEADAWSKGEKESALGYHAAQQEFLSKHLGKWAEKFCERALDEAKTDFYRGFIRLTRGILKEEMEPTV